MASSDTDDADGAQRAAARKAALDELLQWGVDRFSVEGAAQRCSVGVDFFRQQWPNERDLIIEALLEYSESTITVPDTGSLLDDLTVLTLSVAAFLNDAMGRRLLRMLVVDSRSQAVDEETRARFWATRLSTLESIFDHAGERGELRPNVKVFIAIQMLMSPLHTYALYTDVEIAPEYCRVVAEMVARAIGR